VLLKRCGPEGPTCLTGLGRVKLSKLSMRAVKAERKQLRSFANEIGEEKSGHLSRRELPIGP